MNRCFFRKELSTGLLLAVVSLLANQSGRAQIAACVPCEQMQHLHLPEVTIHTATLVEPGEGDPVPGRPHCRVLGVIGREIQFELLLPSDFNGRFVMSGGGGFVGGVSNGLRGLTDGGYATAGTDVGHAEPDPSKWATFQMERQLNFGHMGIHRTAVVCKNLIARYYGADAAYSYFFGASRGGGQALMEAQRYPEDFDGIIAGAPAFNWTGFSAKFIQIAQKMYPDGKLDKPVLGDEQLALLQSRILEACDERDGIRDSILSDPEGCPFDIETLPRCGAGAPGPDCFTEAQLDAIRAVYTPLVVDGQLIHPGFPFGGEAEPNGWRPWIVGEKGTAGAYPSLHTYFGIETFRHLIFNDPEWDYATYDFRNLIRDIRYASHYLDATSTDYSAFKARGGKLLIWHGWADPAVSALDMLHHYRAVRAADPDVDEYIRVYLLPGVLHGPGRGPDHVDWLTVMRNWVENGNAPGEVVASKRLDGRTVPRAIRPYAPPAEVTPGSDIPAMRNRQ